MKQKVVFVDKLTLTLMHGRQVNEHGSAHGIRDKELFETLIDAPKEEYELNTAASVAQLASIYLYEFANENAFVDANLRTAYIAYRLFLRLNGYTITASLEQKVGLMIHVSNQTYDFDDIVSFTQQHLKEMAHE